MTRSIGWLFGLCFVTGACHSPLQAGLGAFHEARYADAAREFRDVDTAHLSPDELARWHLYSGLNHLALGALKAATAHLAHARSWLERQPSSLSPDEQGRLFQAWHSIGRLPGQTLTAAPGALVTPSPAGPSRTLDHHRACQREVSVPR